MSSTTLAVLLRDFVEENGLGKAGVMSAVGSTTTVVDATNFAGPFAGNEWSRGASLRVTSGNRIGQTRPISDFAPGTGTFTVLAANAFTGSAFVANDTFVIARVDAAEHIDRFVEALNRFLTRHAERRMRVPFTYIPNGDLLAAAASTGWTVTGNAAIAYVELAHPNSWYQRVLRLTGGSTGVRVNSTTLQAHAGDVWDIALDMFVGAAGDIASIVVQDESNTAAITPTFSDGAATTSSLAPVEIRAQFTIPAGCTQISIRPTVAADGDIGYFGPIIAAPQGATSYTGQTWLEYVKRVSGLWTFSPGNNGPQERRWQPFGWSRQAEQFGWGQVFSFESVPPFPLYADVLLSYAELSADTDTTACPKDLALAGMAVEFFRWAHAKERQQRGPDSAQTRWGTLLADAEARLVTAQSDWGAPKNISVLRRFAGRASA